MTLLQFRGGGIMRIKQTILISLGIALMLMTVGTAVAVEAPTEEWNKTFGGAYNDGAFSVQQTSDGGYILAGYYRQNSDDFHDGDAWLIMTYANGTVNWTQTFGGSLYDQFNSVQQTSDGGYILAGSTFSFGAVETDALLIKTYANGTEEWNRTFGGEDYDGFNSVQQTSDGEYILAGYTDSDAWLMKTYANGTEEWNMTFGSPSYDAANSVQQTSDGGYILAGYADGYPYNALLIKTYENGTLNWTQRFDGPGSDAANSVQQTDDGGYILAGYTRSIDTDFWLIKTDANGNQEWNKKFGNKYDEYAESVQQTLDGGYILTGRTYSHENKDDAWLIKTNDTGIEEWNMTFGDTGDDQAYSVQQTDDGGYILAGRTAANGNNDAWLIKIAGSSQVDDPAYTIEKIVMDVDNRGPSANVTDEGDIISYIINVTNTGNIDLTNVILEDALLQGDYGNLTGPPEGTLSVDTMWTYYGNYTVQQSDLNNYGSPDAGSGLINNTAYANCTELEKINASTSVPIEMKPVDAIENLQNDTITELEIDTGIDDSLVLRLDNVLQKLAKGDEDKAIKKLEDFINYVEILQKTGKLTDDQAEELIGEANAIIQSIDNSEG
jgi:uncharacterized repeat protein (TIGR01451 family)